jgi:hypothetical protein
MPPDRISGAWEEIKWENARRDGLRGQLVSSQVYSGCYAADLVWYAELPNYYLEVLNYYLEVLNYDVEVPNYNVEVLNYDV